MFKLIVVRFDRNTGTFDDAEFNKFCEEHSIIKIEKETLHVEGNIFYSFFIEYLVLKPKYGKPDLTSLSDSELSQYNRLRDWRNELAASEGLPAYIIMYNSQIMDIIKKQPKAKADFAAIKGMKTKADKYGEQIIKLLQEELIDSEE